MREIKFRAFNKELNKMVYPDKNGWFKYLLRSKKSGALQTVGIDFLIRGDYPEIEVMECTGLTDKDGVEIYEGDVLNAVYAAHFNLAYTGVVKFGEYEQDASGGEYSGERCLGFYIEAVNPNEVDEYGSPLVPEYTKTTSPLGFDDLEVIGNIYEHPELLEVSTE